MSSSVGLTRRLHKNHRCRLPSRLHMDSPTERMPIACVHCAKAKAKCDKKVSHVTPLWELDHILLHGVILAERQEQQAKVIGDAIQIPRPLMSRPAPTTPPSRMSPVEFFTDNETPRFHARDVLASRLYASREPLDALRTIPIAGTLSHDLILNVLCTLPPHFMYHNSPSFLLPLQASMGHHLVSVYHLA